jgi:cytoplasmic iron level regulating protein YaaA (DUF328/UPF0246 family)
MILLLPPSEGKASGGQGDWQVSSGRFGEVLGPLRRTVKRVLVDPELRPSSSRWDGPQTLPAHRRYRGVVWQHLDPDTFDPAMTLRAANSVLVVSALGGFFAWDDPVPAYKLKLGARSEPTGVLSRFWRPALAPLLVGSPVVDLTALEQSAALARPVRSDWVRVELVGPDGARSGHHGKAAKGRLARSLLEHGPDVLDRYEDLEGWTLRLA